MSQYRICSDCGSNLDPGERCDCQDEYRLSAPDVATLILVMIAVNDIAESGELEPDTLDELECLAPKLEALVMRLDEKQRLRTA